MTVWVLIVNGKVDSLHKTSQGASAKWRHLKEINGDQLAVYLREMTVHE